MQVGKPSKLSSIGLQTYGEVGIPRSSLNNPLCLQSAERCRYSIMCLTAGLFGGNRS